MYNVCLCAYSALPSVVVVGQQPPRQGAPHHLHVLSDGVHLRHAHALHSDIELGHERLRASWKRHCQLCKQLQFANLVYVHEARLRGRHGVEHVLLADDGLPQQQTHLGPATNHATYIHSCEEEELRLCSESDSAFEYYLMYCTSVRLVHKYIHTYIGVHTYKRMRKREALTSRPPVQGFRPQRVSIVLFADPRRSARPVRRLLLHRTEATHR